MSGFLFAISWLSCLFNCLASDGANLAFLIGKNAIILILPLL